MRDGIEKGIVLLVTADLTLKKDGVEYETGDDQGEKDNAEDQQSDLAQIQQDPPDVQCGSKDRKADPENDKKYRCFTPTHRYVKSKK